MAKTYKKISGTWYPIKKIFKRISGAWSEIKKLYKKVSGTWQVVHSGAAEYTFTASYTGTVTLATLLDAATISANTDFIINVPAGMTITGPAGAAGAAGGVAFNFTGVTGKNITIKNLGTIKGGNATGANYYRLVDNHGYDNVQYGYWSLTPGDGISFASLISSSACASIWGLYSSAAIPSAAALNSGSSTVTVVGTAAVAGLASAVNYYLDGCGNCCNCSNCSG